MGRIRINLHIVRNDVTYDSRVLKETASLRDSGLFGAIEVAGLQEPGLSERESIDGRDIWRVVLKSRQLPKDLLSQGIKYAEWRYRLLKAYRNVSLSVIHCNDLGPLPIAVRLKKCTGAGLIYDAHELQTERIGSGGLRKRLAWAMEKSCMRWVDGMITVSPSIQKWYQDRFPDVPVALVRNIPSRPAKEFRRVDLRKRLNVPKESLLFIYQGGHSFGRGIDLILDAFITGNVRHHVVFMGDGPIVEKVRKAATCYGNIHWLPPVSPDEVLSMAAGADVGFSMLEDVALNHRYALPNKLFEYWAAGIPAIVSELPEQARLVEQYKAGWVAPRTRSCFAASLSCLSSSDVELMRVGVEKARSELSWANEEKELLSTYRNVVTTVTDGQSPAALGSKKGTKIGIR